jgi:hypothetical protein
VKPVELDDGLWRWTAPHPDWQPGAPESAYDWSRDVGCVLFQTASVALFIDPLLPLSTSPFWRWADERCARRSVAVFTTIAYHARSRDAFVARFGAARYGAGEAESDELLLPGDVLCMPIEGLGETVVWLASLRTLIAGQHRRRRPWPAAPLPRVVARGRARAHHAGRPAGPTEPPAQPADRARARVARRPGAERRP